MFSDRTKALRDIILSSPQDSNIPVVTRSFDRHRRLPLLQSVLSTNFLRDSSIAGFFNCAASIHPIRLQDLGLDFIKQEGTFPLSGRKQQNSLAVMTAVPRLRDRIVAGHRYGI